MISRFTGIDMEYTIGTGSMCPNKGAVISPYNGTSLHRVAPYSGNQQGNFIIAKRTHKGSQEFFEWIGNGSHHFIDFIISYSRRT